MQFSDARAQVELSAPGVLLVRHGQTEWNAEGRWQGWADIALTDAGVAQAREGAARLASLIENTPVVVVSSDLERARATAGAIAEALGAELEPPMDDLRERHIGAWSGLLTAEIEAGWPGWLGMWRDGELASTPNGEAEAELRARTSGALQLLSERAVSEDCVVIAVTHGGVMRTLSHMFGGKTRPVGNLGGAWFKLVNGSPVHVGDVHLLEEGDGGGPQTGTAL